MQLTKRNKVIGGSIAAVALAGAFAGGLLVANASPNAAGAAMTSVSDTPNGNYGNGANGNGSNGRSRSGGREAREAIDPATVAIAQAAAEATAVAEVGGGEADSAVLRAVRGDADTIVWHIHVSNGDQSVSVDVDANTGAVVSTMERAERGGSNGNGNGRSRSGSREAIDPATVAISQATAEATAIAEVGGGEADSAVLRAVRGDADTIVWHVHVTDGDQSVSVDVDANTGAVLGTTDRAERPAGSDL